jgi:uncharacterized protein
MLKQKLVADLKEAEKEQDCQRGCTLRLVLAAIKDKERSAPSAETAEEIGDDEIRAILARMVSQRQESAREYEQAGRLELAEQEQSEIRILREYLPRPMSEVEVEQAIRCAIQDVGGRSIRDMGRIMAKLKCDHQGRMDFAKAGAAVKTALR